MNRLTILLTVAFAATLIAATSLVDQPPLAAAVEFVRSQPTLHLACTVTSRVLDETSNASFRSRGTLRYTQQGERFRIESSIKGDHAAGSTITYDGSVFHYRDALTGGEGATPGLPADGNFGSALPIPFLEAVSFLAPASEDDERAYRPWQSVVGISIPAATVGWHDAIRDGRRCLQATFPGASYEGSDYSMRVTVDKRDTGWPWIMERVTASGEVMTRSTFESIEAFGAATGIASTTSGGVETPLVMRFEMFDQGGSRLAHELLFVVTDLRLGANANAMATPAAFEAP